MGQTKIGGIKIAAKYYGLSVEEYLMKITTENYCNKCKSWKLKNKFGKDLSRSTGLNKNCNDCRWVNGGKKKGFKKGTVSLFKGKTHSLKTKALMRENNKGDKNPNWKGGTTNLITQIRNTFEFKKWRKAVYFKGKFTCSDCGIKKIGNNITIDADHIYPLSKIISDFNIKSVEESFLINEIWDVNNGRCLCRKCHKKTDTWGVNANKKKNGNKK